MSHHSSLCAENVVSTMKVLFKDNPIFMTVEPRLEEVIVYLCKNPIGFEPVKRLSKIFFPDDADVCKEIQWILATCCVFVVFFEDRAKKVVWESTAVLTAAYPSFSKYHPHELELLLLFRNAIRVAMLIMGPNRKKDQFLYIATRIEAAKVKYITGSGQSQAAEDRVKIFRQETGVIKEDRSYRTKSTSPAVSLPTPSKKTKRCSNSASTPTARVAVLRSDAKSGQKRKVEDSLVTPARPTQRRNNSMTATKANKAPPAASPRAPEHTPAPFKSIASDTDVTQSVAPLRSVTPSPILREQSALHQLSAPPTPAKALRSSSEHAHCMVSSTDWPKLPLFGASREEPVESAAGWSDFPAVVFQPIATVPSPVEFPADSSYLTEEGLRDILGDFWDTCQ